MPAGFRGQDDNGAAMYAAYVTRAQFPEIVDPTLAGMLGVVHERESQVDLPSSLEYLWEDANGEGLPLEALHQKITEEILTCGRVALLSDPPSMAEGGGDPRIKLYTSEALINWSPKRDFYVLSEGALVREGFAWEERDSWRVLRLSSIGEYSQQEYDERGDVVRDEILPERRGGGSLDRIPLVIVGSRDLEVEPDNPPLLGVARSALACYRLDADYRHQLFMTGQETLVFSGLAARDVPKTIGAGVAIALESPDAHAEYVGPSGAGIEAHERAIAAERANAAALGARVFDTSDQKAGVESGDALRIRRRATTATLLSVALCSARGLEAALRDCGRLAGLSEAEVEDIVVTPNLEFADAEMTPAEALQIVQVWQSGAIAYETLYENLQRGGIASTERTAEEEQALVESETPDVAAGGGGPPSDGGGEDTGDGSDVPPEDLAGLFSSDLLAQAA